MRLRASFAAAVAVALLATSGVAFANQGAVRLKERGSAQDQQACTPDVFRLCFSQIPNEPAIVSCLKRSMPQLSPSCRAVMQPSGGRSRKAVHRSRDPLHTGSVNRR